MGDFSVVFVKVEGLDEIDLGTRNLEADTLEKAKEEALICERPPGTNSIKICREGLKDRQLMVSL